MRQKQDLLSQSLECYIHRVVLIPGFARERKKEVVFSLSTLISYYPSVTKEDNSIVLYCIVLMENRFILNPGVQVEFVASKTF